jgi:aminoglycoside phosphotransferase (APT) family kinase protein
MSGHPKGDETAVDVLIDLQTRLDRFLRAQTGDPHAEVAGVEVMPGHAGFSYGFTARYSAQGVPQQEAFVMRLPPPGVKLQGTADVLRQARILHALQGSAVPVVPVRWSGDDPRWFERPYLIVPRLTGDTLRVARGEWGADLDASTLRVMARAAVAALAALHTLDWRATVPAWGPPLEPAADVLRWDRFYERAADPELVRLVPEVRQRLLAFLPATTHVGIFHGDYQWANLLYGHDRHLQAVIDWELAGVGAVLNDLGWIMIFSDPQSWADPGRIAAVLPPPADLVAMYRDACAIEVESIAWYRALAGYKFAVIGGFNLMLHRRGKRHDPLWEELAPSIPRLLKRALEVLDGA